MDVCYVYIRSLQVLVPSSFKDALKRIINQPFELSFDGKEGKITIDEEGVTSLYNSILILQNDLMCSITMLIVPKFDDICKFIFDNFYEAGLFNVNAILPKMIISIPKTKELLNQYFKGISSEIIESVKKYIELDMSINLVAKAMYTHRNTINYRINKFYEKSGINVRKVTNAYFIYLIMTFNSVERILL